MLESRITSNPSYSSSYPEAGYVWTLHNASHLCLHSLESAAPAGYACPDLPATILNPEYAANVAAGIPIFSIGIAFLALGGAWFLFLFHGPLPFYAPATVVGLILTSITLVAGAALIVTASLLIVMLFFLFVVLPVVMSLLGLVALPLLPSDNGENSHRPATLSHACTNVVGGALELIPGGLLAGSEALLGAAGAVSEAGLDAAAAAFAKTHVWRRSVTAFFGGGAAVAVNWMADAMGAAKSAWSAAFDRAFATIGKPQRLEQLLSWLIVLPALALARRSPREGGAVSCVRPRARANQVEMGCPQWSACRDGARLPWCPASVSMPRGGAAGRGGRGLVCAGAIWPVLLRRPLRGCDPACCSSLSLTGACVFFVVFSTMQLAEGYSEGSMGPDIHPYPEDSESALMVCPHIAGQ